MRKNTKLFIFYLISIFVMINHKLLDLMEKICRSTAFDQLHLRVIWCLCSMVYQSFMDHSSQFYIQSRYV